MEVLKEILAKSKKTVINEEFVVIDGREVDKREEIEIGEQSGKFYSLEQLTFFILNKDVMYTQYLKKCKEQGITPIFYTDQKLILEELQKIKEEVPQYHFDAPEDIYLSKHDYSWVCKLFTEKGRRVKFKTNNEPFRIVVPSSLISFITLSNIERFLRDGNISKNSSLVLDKLNITVKDKSFIVEDTIDNWTSDDWKNLVGIFLDGSAWQINEWGIGDVAGLFSKIPVFYVYENGNEKPEALEGYKINRIRVENRMCKKEDFENMWKLILKICESDGNGL